MSVVKRISDGIVNVVAQLGTRRDKASHSQYIDNVLTPHELLAAYSNSWLAGAIVDYPADDATRKWRNWRAEADQITKIEELEKSMSVQKRVRDALVAARLYGGAAIYINTGESQQESQLRPGAEIRSLIVLTPNSLAAERIVRDINSPYYGKPEFYTLTTGDNAARVRIHASRLVVFRGASVPDDIGGGSETRQAWGDSVLQKTYDAVQQMDTTMANMASLVFEAKVDVFKFEGFAELLANHEDTALIRRLQSQAAMKGINGAVVIDAKDDYQQKSSGFGGLPDVVGKFQENLSGASGIPITRLYGRSSAGLSGSGDGDERVYYDRIGHLQATMIQPAMSLLDDCLITQALGTRPQEVFFEWRPLRQMTEGERANIFGQIATAARTIAGANSGELVPIDALSDALVNELTEQGCLPGLDQAIEKYGSLAEQGLPAESGEGDNTTPVHVGDAAPRPLYVSRKVLNAEEIFAHYKKQGVESLASVDDMHVTITYSRQPVDWMKMGEAWEGELTVNAGGARLMEVFGQNKDTLVLAFVSSALSWRHEGMVQAGASWDWPEYQPHVSISYAFDGDVDGIEPWRGEIKFGPEIFEAIDEDWISSVGDGGFDPNQPRNAQGEWTNGGSGGVSGSNGLSAAQRSASIKDYTGEGYRSMNAQLRGFRKESDDVSKKIKDLDQILSDASLQESATLYRGVSGLAAKQILESKPKKGAILEDAAFLSTSREAGVAGQFAAASRDYIVLKISAKQGSRGLDVSKTSDNPSEKEVILPRGAKLKVVKYTAKSRTLEVSYE